VTVGLIPRASFARITAKGYFHSVKINPLQNWFADTHLSHSGMGVLRKLLPLMQIEVRRSTEAGAKQQQKRHLN
jgi:hypothetical protein